MLKRDVTRRVRLRDHGSWYYLTCRYCSGSWWPKEPEVHGAFCPIALARAILKETT